MDMKKIMKWVWVLLAGFAVMGFMFLMLVLIRGVVTPMLGVEVTEIMVNCFSLGASALYWFGVIKGLFWLAETGYFE